MREFIVASNMVDAESHWSQDRGMRPRQQKLRTAQRITSRGNTGAIRRDGGGGHGRSLNDERHGIRNGFDAAGMHAQ